eukprot:scaffold625_cov324-Pavlova_lutheri.AAC.52
MRRHVKSLEELGRRLAHTTAWEVSHIRQRKHREWLERAEVGLETLDVETRRRNLVHLLRASMLERFLGEKFPSSKRFGIEGEESLIPGMAALVQELRLHGVECLGMGMAHRGRLNVMHSLLGKQLGSICLEMNGEQSDFHVGDVKYHLGQSGEYATVKLQLLPNPSHLEAVSPVVLGWVRAKQTRNGVRSQEAARRYAAIVLHGDAAFCGLGMTQEVLQMSSLEGYSVGGTIHIVINNQIGFTTRAESGRSTLYATDVARGFDIPVVHVDADDVDAVTQAMKMAADWRCTWGRDVVVDLVGYRRHGHNEQDDPTITLPLLYKDIKQRPSALTLYSEKLVNEGVVTEKEIDEEKRKVQEGYEHEFSSAREHTVDTMQFILDQWSFDTDSSPFQDRGMRETTGAPLEELKIIGERISAIKMDFNYHPHILELNKKRFDMIASSDKRVDWAMAEALAFGSILATKASRSHRYNIRLSGQDSERGTFNQRHMVLNDQETGHPLVPLNHIFKDQGQLEIWNSPLSEAGVLGFEYGFSMGNDHTLVVWEAQFGDFANNAQAIIDCFVASAEEKWGEQSKLVLLLPHGYDGQGPDHSSARLERFLQLCNSDPDRLPGETTKHQRQIHALFNSMDTKKRGLLYPNDLRRHTQELAGVQFNALRDLLLDVSTRSEAENGLDFNKFERLMVQFIRRNSEKDASMFVVNASTPANYFHALRRQLFRPFKKPLVVMSPKWLLHHRPCTSAFEDFGPDSRFTRVIDDGQERDNTRHRSHHPVTGLPFLLSEDQIQRVILCSGQIYYHLSRYRRSKRIRDTVLVRLEQIAPFPHDKLTSVISRYYNAEVFWVQEEPKNMGGWPYVKPRLEVALSLLCAKQGRSPARQVTFVGRPPSASTATASMRLHLADTQVLIEKAFAQGLVDP